MSIFIKIIYTLLFISLLVQPHIIKTHISFLTSAYSQTISTVIIFLIAYFTYTFSRREIRKKEAKLSIMDQKLLDSFKYIGIVNRRLPLLKNLTSNLLEKNKISKQEKKQIFQNLLATAVVSIAKVNWGFIRFIDTTSQKTAKEFIFINKNYIVLQKRIGNRELLDAKKQPTTVKELDNLWIIPTTEREAVIQGYLVFSKPSEPLDDERFIFQAIVDQAQLFYKYLY